MVEQKVRDGTTCEGISYALQLRRSSNDESKLQGL